MVLLVTSDNEQFRTEAEVVERSRFLKCFVDGTGDTDEPIHLPNVSSNVMKKVLEYCEHHRGEPLQSAETDEGNTGSRTTDISEWDQQFIGNDRDMLFELIQAANYLDIPPLLKLGCETVSNMMKGKTPAEIRKLFKITNDFTSEEEAQIKVQP